MQNTVKVELSHAGISVKELYYSEFPIQMDFAAFCRMLSGYRNIKKEYHRTKDDASIERYELEIGGECVLCLEARDEIPRFFTSFEDACNAFISYEPANVIKILETAGGERASARLVPIRQETYPA